MSTPYHQYKLAMGKYDHFEKAKTSIHDALSNREGREDVDWSSIDRLFAQALIDYYAAKKISEELEDSDFASQVRVGEESPYGFDEIKDKLAEFEDLVGKMSDFIEDALEQLDLTVD